MANASPQNVFLRTMYNGGGSVPDICNPIIEIKTFFLAKPEELSGTW